MKPITKTAAAWREAVTRRSPEIEARLADVYGGDPDILESRRALIGKALDAFISAYGPERSVVVSRAPGRINLLGNHVDHRGGYLNFVAINRDTIMVAAPREDDRIVLHNAADRFEATEFSVGELLPPEARGRWLEYIETAGGKPHIWQNYVKAAALCLQDRFADRTLKGMDVAVAGDVPIAAGLSSSSTLVVSTFQAVCALNGLDIPEAERAEFCGLAEWYVGTRGGSGDHAAMLYGKRLAVVRTRFFPLVTQDVPLPDGYRIVACNSCVEHAPPGIFNERIATYTIGLLLLKKAFPVVAEKAEHLRDVRPQTLGVSLAELYDMLKVLPERMTRDEIRAALPGQEEALAKLFTPHPEPQEGYRVRQVVLYGIAECERSERGGELLESGDLKGFGRYKYLSHDGDRRVRFIDGKPEPVDNRVTDADLDALIAAASSDSPDAALAEQSGGYDCSCEELDQLVDIARGIDGVIGAGLAGGGLGGCVLVVVREDAVDSLIDAVNTDYYGRRNLPESTLVCASSAGACII